VACLPAPSSDHVLELRDVAFTLPMTVADDAAAELRVQFSAGLDATDFVVRGICGGESRVHVQGTVAWVPGDDSPRHHVAELLTRCGQAVREISEAESAQPAGPLALGPHWRNLRRVHDGGEEELARLEATELVAGELADYPLHPALFDESTAFGLKGRKGRYLPFGFGRVLIRRPLTATLWSHLRYREAGSGEIISTDLTLLDDNGVELIAVSEFMLRRTDAAAVTAAAAESTVDEVRLTSGISPAEGVEAFHRLLANDLGPQVVVAGRPLAVILAQAAAPPVIQAGPVRQAPAVAREGFVPLKTATEQNLAAIWGEILGVTEIGADDNFFELGGNSLVAMQLIASIRAGLGVKLPMRILFDAPTVSAMAKQIEELKAVSPAAAPAAVTIPRLARQAR
jgi:phthiocerol/phenolphthiocerol synthesis type-I polyketide synthase E